MVLALSFVIAVTACNKEGQQEPTTGTPSSSIEQLNAAFNPSPADAMVYIRSFEQLKREFAENREESEKPLGEALWICEADLNYARGSAGVRLDTLILDSIFFVLPVRLDQSGQYWVRDADLISKQDELYQLIPAEGERTVRFIDITLMQLTEVQALFRARINRRPPGGGGGYEPPPTGAFALGQDEWIDVMHQYLNYYDFHACPHSFLVTVSGEQVIYDNDYYSVVGGYVMYTGTNASLGGPALIPQGPAGELVWFPAQWEKHLALREWYYGQFAPEPGRRLINEHYVQYYLYHGGQPIDYGSPFYPMGPWLSRFEFVRAIEICPGLPSEE